MEEKILSNSVKAVTRCARVLEKTRMLPQRIRRRGWRQLMAPLALCWLLAPAAGHAATVEIQSARQITATADFRPGQAGKPAILLLHGFLQTRDFAIIKSLADTLADEGYTVLSPTLSLGISHRKGSLDCEALHLHDMDGDIREIQQWVAWLHGRGHEQIIGIGHSFGGTQLLAWREKYRERNFSLIGVSMVGSAPFSPDSRVATVRKTASQKPSNAGLVHAPLSFCNTYTAPADKYASYHRWNESRILAALEHSGTQLDVILGSDDKFPPPNWDKQLAKAGAKIHHIKGANHFMDGTQEFDMFDTILGIVKK